MRNSASPGPLVSIVVPAYNAAAHIADTLQSLIDQTYSNLEIVVVDDGSDDETFSLARKQARSHSQIRLLQQSNMGVAAARNRGIAMSSGDFIAPVDADDIWFPDAAEKLAKRLSRAPDRTGVAYAWSVTLDEEGRLDGGFRCSMIEGNVFNSLCAHNFIGNASSTMFRRSCIDAVGGYDESFRTQAAQGCEDWDLYLRIAEEFHFGVVPEFLVGYRRSTLGMSANACSMAKSHDYLLRRAKQRRPDLPRALCRLSKSGLYLYLAQECERWGWTRQSHRWWLQALVHGRLLCLLRPACYTLAARNALRSAGDTIRRLFRRADRRAGSIGGSTREHMRSIRIGDISRRRSRIRARLLQQDILHLVLSRIAPTSDTSRTFTVGDS